MSIEVAALVKTYGEVRAVDNLTFTAPSGKVTGFLGPNGAGKSTTMRMIIGLDHPTSGCATIGGRPFSDFTNPVREVGVLLDAASAPSRMSARTHLRWIAQAARIPRDRADEIMELVGLGSAASRRIGSFSLGMRQRLGIAVAILGDPGTILLDEPVNGLDPEGIRWVRDLMRSMADEGRTVLISSHLMSETQQVADRVVVIARGRLLRDMPTKELMSNVPGDDTRVRCNDPGALSRALERHGARVRREDSAAVDLFVRGVTPETIGEIALQSHVVIHLLTPVAADLEDVFMQLTSAENLQTGRTAE